MGLRVTELGSKEFNLIQFSAALKVRDLLQDSGLRDWTSEKVLAYMTARLECRTLHN